MGEKEAGEKVEDQGSQQGQGTSLPGHTHLRVGCFRTLSANFKNINKTKNRVFLEIKFYIKIQVAAGPSPPSYLFALHFVFEPVFFFGYESLHAQIIVFLTFFVWIKVSQKLELIMTLWHSCFWHWSKILKVSWGFWRFFAHLLLWCFYSAFVSPILWIFTEIECLCLKTPLFHQTSVAICILHNFSNDTNTTLHTYSFLFCFFSIRLNPWNNNRRIRAGRDEAEWNGIGPTRAVKETRDGTGGRSKRVHLLSFLNSFYYPLLLILLLSLCLFSIEYNDRQSEWGVTGAGGTTYCSRPPREVGGNRYVFRYFYVLYSPLLFLSLFLFSDYCPFSLSLFARCPSSLLRHNS